MTEPKPIVSVDFETRSATDLRKTGVYRYAGCHTTDIWCMAYAFDDEEPRVWVPGDPVDQRLADHISEGGMLRAWNANFERVIWNCIMVRRYGWPATSSTQWHCTMAQARAMGLPGALGQAAAVLAVEQQKDKEGQALMMRMARPRRTTENGEHVWWDVPSKIKQLIDYCVQDVHTEVSVAKALTALSPTERNIFLLDQRINDRGMCLDLPLLHLVRDLADKSRNEINVEIARLTSGAVKSATRGSELIEWLGRYGVVTKSVDKHHVAKMLEDDRLHPVIRRVLELRQAGAKSSTAKLDSMNYAVCVDGRMRGLLQYHGAATGRWSGRLVQPQNFPRPSLGNEEIEEVIGKLLTHQDTAEHGHGTVLASDLLRSLLVAAPGHRLMFADYSAIEARVLAWMAGQQDLVDAFAAGRDVYIDMAARITGRRPDSIPKSSPARQLGKGVILGCGFGMSAKRFADYSGVDLPTAQTSVAAYREQNHRIVAYWRELEELYLSLGREAIERGESYMQVPLPSGRYLTYHGPKIVQRETPWGEMRDTLQVETLNSFTRQWTTQLIWGGLATENCIAEDTLVLTDGGWKPIQSVRDSDLVHDGVDFVAHGGLVFKSVQTCTEIDGVWMTPDHEVLTDDGWAAAQTEPRPYRPTIWGLDSPAPRTPRWQEIILAVSVRLRRAMRKGRNGGNQGCGTGANAKLRMPDFASQIGAAPNSRHEPTPRVCSLAEHERPVPVALASGLAELWRARDNSVRELARQVRELLERYGAELSAWVGIRPDRQRRPLLAGELPMGYETAERYEPEGYYPKSRRSGVIEGDRYKSVNDILPVETWMGGRGTAPHTPPRKPVYDIVNAGPRHRFVVLGDNGPFIVHNCVQATARDIMAHAMMRLEMLGYPVVCSVHDEIICEVPDGQGTLEEMVQIMTAPPPWAKDCPINAEGEEGKRYRK